MTQLVRFGALSIAVVALAVGPGCVQEEPPPDVGSSAEALTASVVDGGGLVARLAAMLEAGLREQDGARVRARVRTALEELVAQADCLSLEWSFPAATVHFDGCIIPQTGERLDGALGVRLRLLDPAVVVTLDALTVGDDVFDGGMTAYPTGQPSSLGIGVDADVTAVGGATLVGSLGLLADAGGVTLSGSGDVVSPSVDAAATMTGVHWNFGDCLPSSGSVTFADGNASIDVTFLETTPATGEVSLHVPPLPPTTSAMFPACP